MDVDVLRARVLLFVIVAVLLLGEREVVRRRAMANSSDHSKSKRAYNRRDATFVLVGIGSIVLLSLIGGWAVAVGFGLGTIALMGWVIWKCGALLSAAWLAIKARGQNSKLSRPSWNTIGNRAFTCPRCRAQVAIAEPAADEPTFTCDQCGAAARRQ